MTARSYYTNTLLDSKIFESRLPEDDDAQKMTSLYLTGEISDEIMKNTCIELLVKADTLVEECCIFYDDKCGVICSETDEECITIRDFYEFDKDDEKVKMVLQTLFLLLQSPIIGKKYLTVDVDDEAIEEAIEDMIEGASTSDMLYIDEFAGFMGEDVLVDMENYNYKFEQDLAELEA